MEYLVRWEGVGPSGDTFEPRSALYDTIPEMIDEYDALHASTAHSVPILTKPKPKPTAGQPKAPQRPARAKNVPARLKDT